MTARLVVESGAGAGAVVTLAATPITVGRDPGCDLVLPDDRASRRHATLTPLPDGGVRVEDHGSTNGTYVDGQRLTGSVTLQGSHQLRFADTTVALTAGSTPSRIERLALGRSIRRSRWIAAVAGLGAIAAVAVIVLAATGAFDGGGEELTAAQIVERAAPATVQIVGLAGGQEVSYGTGWVYDAARGLVVTSASALNPSAEWVVRLAEEERDREVALVGIAPCQDVAVLRVQDTTGLVAADLGAQADLERGEDVVALGYPVTQLSPSGRLVANGGVVSVPSAATNQPGLPRLQGVILTDLSLNPGNEGGPLLDRTAKLVGMNVRFRAGGIGAQGQSYAIGVDRLAEVVPDLAEGRSAGWSGLEFDYGLDEAAHQQLGLPFVAGLVVTRAVPGTSAAQSGFGSVPAIVTAVDGQSLDGTLASFCDAAAELTRGDSASVTYIQAGETEPRTLSLRFD